jgi:hypothetical protein
MRPRHLLTPGTSTTCFPFLKHLLHIISQSSLSPQPLQLPQYNHIRIQEPIHTLPHTRLLVFIQFARFDGTRGDTFAETCVG